MVDGIGRHLAFTLAAFCHAPHWSAILNQYGGYSSVAERRSVAADVVGSKPTSRPNFLSPPRRLSCSRDRRTVPLPSPDSKIQMAPKTPRAEPISAQAPAPPNLFAGTSGWAYPTWKPGFYPADVLALRSKFLHRTMRRDSTRSRSTTPSAPACTPPSSSPTGSNAVPPTFRFSFKAPAADHALQPPARLRRHVAEFLQALEPMPANPASSAFILFQFPPNFKADLDRLACLSLARRRSRGQPVLPSPSSSATTPGSPNPGLRFACQPQRSRPLRRGKRQPRHAGGPSRGGPLPASVSAATAATPQPELEASRARFTALATTRTVYAYFKPRGRTDRRTERQRSSSRPRPPDGRRIRSQRPSTRGASSTNGHLQTIFGNFLPRPIALPVSSHAAQLVEVSPGTGSQIASQVLCQCHWQPAWRCAPAA